MKKLSITSSLFGLVGMAVSNVASAQILQPNDQPTNAGNITDLRSGVVGIINYFLLFLGLVAVAFIIWAGIQMATSSGNEQKVKSAQKTITYAIVGLIVVFLAYAIVNWVAVIPTQVGG